MNASFSPAAVLRQARIAAGLSQRQLALRADTTQAVVARIESGAVAPNWETLSRLLRETGHDVELRVHTTSVVAPEWMDEVRRIRAMPAAERLAEVGNLSAFVLGARRRA